MCISMGRTQLHRERCSFTLITPQFSKHYYFIFWSHLNKLASHGECAIDFAVFFKKHVPSSIKGYLFVWVNLEVDLLQNDQSLKCYNNGC